MEQLLAVTAQPGGVAKADASPAGGGGLSNEDDLGEENEMC